MIAPLAKNKSNLKTFTLAFFVPHLETECALCTGNVLLICSFKSAEPLEKILSVLPQPVELKGL